MKPESIAKTLNYGMLFASIVLAYMISPFFPPIAKHQFGLLESQIGYIFAAFSVGYAGGNLLMSLLDLSFMTLRQINLTIRLFIMLFVVVTSLFAFAPDFLHNSFSDKERGSPSSQLRVTLTFALLRFFQGLFAAVVDVVQLLFLVRMFPDAVSKVVGEWEAVIGLGVVCGPPMGGLLFQLGGFRLPFLTMSGLTAAVCLVSLFYMERSKPLQLLFEKVDNREKSERDETGDHSTAGGGHEEEGRVHTSTTPLATSANHPSHYQQLHNNDSVSIRSAFGLNFSFVKVSSSYTSSKEEEDVLIPPGLDQSSGSQEQQQHQDGGSSSFFSQSSVQPDFWVVSFSSSNDDQVEEKEQQKVKPAEKQERKFDGGAKLPLVTPVISGLEDHTLFPQPILLAEGSKPNSTDSIESTSKTKKEGTIPVDASDELNTKRKSSHERNSRIDKNAVAELNSSSSIKEEEEQAKKKKTKMKMKFTSSHLIQLLFTFPLCQILGPVVLTTIAMSAFALFMSMIAIYYKHEFSISAGELGLMIGANAVLYAISSVSVGRYLSPPSSPNASSSSSSSLAQIAKRRYYVLILGILLTGFLFFFLIPSFSAVSSSPEVASYTLRKALAVISSIAIGATFGMVTVPSQAIIVDTAKAKSGVLVPAAGAIGNMASSLGSFLGPILGAQFIQSHGFSVTFFIWTCAAILASFLYWLTVEIFLCKNMKRKENEVRSQYMLEAQHQEQQQESSMRTKNGEIDERSPLIDFTLST